MEHEIAIFYCTNSFYDIYLDSSSFSLGNTKTIIVSTICTIVRTPHFPQYQIFSDVVNTVRNFHIYISTNKGDIWGERKLVAME